MMHFVTFFNVVLRVCVFCWISFILLDILSFHLHCTASWRVQSENVDLKCDAMTDATVKASQTYNQPSGKYHSLIRMCRMTGLGTLYFEKCLVEPEVSNC